MRLAFRLICAHFLSRPDSSTSLGRWKRGPCGSDAPIGARPAQPTAGALGSLLRRWLLFPLAFALSCAPAVTDEERALACLEPALAQLLAWEAGNPDRSERPPHPEPPHGDDARANLLRTSQNPSPFSTATLHACSGRWDRALAALADAPEEATRNLRMRLLLLRSESMESLDVLEAYRLARDGQDPEHRLIAALALTWLPFPEQAMRAWQEYAERGPEAHQGDARRIAARLGTELRTISEDARVLQSSEAIANAAALGDVARRSPELSHRALVERLPLEWARARLAGDENHAVTLNAIQALGEALLASWPDGQVDDLLAAFRDEADPGPVEAFAGAVELYRSQRVNEARQGFERAVGALTDDPAPFGYWSRHYLGITLAFEDLAVAEQIWTELLDDLPPDYHLLRGRVLWRLGISAYDRNDPQAALDAYRAAQPELDQSVGPEGSAFGMLMIADVLDRLGQHREAWRERRLGALIVAARDDPWSKHSMWMNTAFALVESGRAALARPYVEALEENAARWGNPMARFESEIMRARLALAEPEALESAEAALAAAIESLAQVSPGPLQDTLRATVKLMQGLATMREDPESAVDLLEAGFLERAHNGSEFDFLTAVQAVARAAAAIEDHQQSLAILSRGREVFEGWLSELEAPPAQRALIATSAVLDEAIVEVLLAAEAPPAEILDSLENSWGKIFRSNAGGALDTREPDRDTVVIVAAPIGAELFGFVIESPQIRLVRRPFDLRQFEQDVQRIDVGAARGRLDDDGRSALRRVSRSLLGLLESVDDERILVWVPSPQLRSAPFLSLLDPLSDRPVLEARLVTTSPTVSLATSPPPRAGERRALIVADPRPAEDSLLPALPGAREEARLVSRHYVDRVTLLTGSEARVARYRAELAHHSVLHFAGHGRGAGSSGADAGLFLVSEEGGDHLLSADEILLGGAADLELAVLSACETAAPGLDNGADLWGVAGVLRLRGAGAVVATRVPIQDGVATSFVDRLHAHFTSGLCAACAFRQAVLDELRADFSNGADLANGADLSNGAEHSDAWMAFTIMGGL